MRLRSLRLIDAAFGAAMVILASLLACGSFTIWPLLSPPRDLLASQTASSLKGQTSDDCAPQLNNETDNSTSHCSSSSSLLLPKTTRICLIHIGKTAGVRIRREIGRLGKDKPDTPPSALKEHTVGFVHVMLPWCTEGSFDAYLYTLRNPLDRLVSWYFYEHPINGGGYISEAKRAFHRWGDNTNGCFRTLDEFARNAFVPNDNATGKVADCQRLAFSVANGRIPCNAHNAMGYAFYFKRMKEFSSRRRRQNNNMTELMLAIRTEHLAEDWDKLEDALVAPNPRSVNGTIRFRTRSKNSRQNNNQTGPQELSEEGRLNLCAALCNEIQVYKQLLLDAVNLDELQVRQSLQEIVSSCPEETPEIRQCGGATQK